VELLVQAASTHAELRQFQAALKLYDRGLDIVPNEPNLMASKAGIYQAEGDLEQAAKFLSQINAQTPSPIALGIKMTQLRLEGKYAEVIRLLQARQARPPSASETIKAITQVELALHQRVASDTTLRHCCLWLMPRSGRRTQLSRKRNVPSSRFCRPPKTECMDLASKKTSL
jgi:tetratricopeptide (TPR) repeat protein